MQHEEEKVCRKKIEKEKKHSYREENSNINDGKIAEVITKDLSTRD